MSDLPSAEEMISEAVRHAHNPDDVQIRLKRGAMHHQLAAEKIVANAQRTASDNRRAQFHIEQSEKLNREAKGYDVDLGQVIGGELAPIPSGELRDTSGARSGQNRDAAHRQADANVRRSVQEGLISTRAADAVTRLLDGGPVAARGRAARWAAAAGDPAYAEAFAAVAVDPIKGHMAWTDDQRRAFQAVELVKRDLSEYTPSGAGYMVPVSLDPSIAILSDGVASPLRSLARVVQITTDRWSGLSSEGVTSEWKPELQEVEETTPTVNNPQVPVHMISMYTEYSVELGMDVRVLVDELRKLMLDEYVIATETAYATGDGIGKPHGIVPAIHAYDSASSVVAPTTPETWAATTDPLKVQLALPPRWQSRAQWLAHLSVLHDLEKAETSNGAKLYEGIGSGSLLRKPISELSTLDPVSGISASEDANNNLLLYGDLSSAFLIADRVGATVEFIPVVIGTNRRPTGARGVWFYARTGSGLINGNAVRLLDVETSQS